MMTHLRKGDVFELRRPVDGDVSPGSHDGVSELGESAIDSADMRRLGRSQQLQRNFHSLSTLGLTCVIMGTWLGMIASAAFSLINGGRGGFMWMFIITWLFQFPVIGSMAEMASMAPTCAGQYHWVSEFAPPLAQKFLSYISGWLSALGWQALLASTAYSCGAFILGLASLNGTYTPERWQYGLLTILFGFLAVLFNMFGAKHLPLFEGIILLFNILGFFAVCIPLWVLSPKAPTHEVWFSFNNGGNWSGGVGAACIIGLLNSSGAFLGADSAAHLAEEVKSASITVPRVMMFTVILNGVLGFIGALTYNYAIQDLEAQILNSKYAFSFIGVFHDATGSNAAAIGMTMPWLVLATASSINSVAAASRQAWSFSRDGGFPFSHWFQKITMLQGTPLPVNAMIASMSMTVVFSIILIGSEEAWNSIAGLVNGAIGLTYALSIGCVLWRRLFGAPLPHARFSLGRFGILINLAGFLFQVVVTVISFFPEMPNPSAADMNWGIAMFAGPAVLASIYYVAYGRKTYRGPVSLIKVE